MKKRTHPGASVAQIARKRGFNANLVLFERKTYREGLLPEAKPTLMPVTLTPLMLANQLPALCSLADMGCLTTEFRYIRVRIEVSPDAEMLRLDLARSRHDGYASRP